MPLREKEAEVVSCSLFSVHRMNQIVRRIHGYLRGSFRTWIFLTLGIITILLGKDETFKKFE